MLLSVVAPATYNAERFLRACVEEGTAWLDLSGEVPWIRKMIQRYGDRARETGAIVWMADSDFPRIMADGCR